MGKRKPEDVVRSSIWGHSTPETELAFEALSALVQQRDDLIAAIEKHRRDIWGTDDHVGHPEDVALYQVLARGKGGK